MIVNHALQNLLHLTESAPSISDPKNTDESGVCPTEPNNDISKEGKEDSTEGVRKFWGKVRRNRTVSLFYYQDAKLTIKCNVGKSYRHRGERHRQKPPLLHRHHWHGAGQSARF